MSTDPAVSQAKQGIQTSVANINSILNKMNADHPGDIIADIMHWCDRYNEDFNNLLENGQGYYAEEIRG
jgi:hypothetical protein